MLNWSGGKVRPLQVLLKESFFEPIADYDATTAVELIEHLDTHRTSAFEQVLLRLLVQKP